MKTTCSVDPCVREAKLWEAKDDGTALCRLCRHECRISEGKTGICGVRVCEGGALKTLVYGRLVAERPDPVEKKPLYHFLPGTLTHSLATVGCNLSCAHCQNFSISQARGMSGKLPGSYTDPETLISNAIEAGAKSVSYTYTEPTVFMEYALDVMALAHEKGLLNIFVTNGFMSLEALEAMDGLLDAANVDLKSMREETYRKLCGARLSPILENIERLIGSGVWVEVTTLVIPGINDSDEELGDAADFLKDMGETIPWHVTGFYPTFRLIDRPPTPVGSLTRAREIGLAKGLRYVYQGNRPGSGGENTACHSCGRTVISREGFALVENLISRSGNCSFCGNTIPGRFGGENGLQ